MGAIAGRLIAWISSLSGGKFDKVKAIVGGSLGISTSLPKGGFVQAVTNHMNKHPYSYATILGGLSSYANEIVSFVTTGGGLSDEEISTVKSIIGSMESLPASSFGGADGDPHKVNGMDEDEFISSVQVVEGARKNVQEIANILGVTPQNAIELALRFNSVEPQHIKLFQ